MYWKVEIENWKELKSLAEKLDGFAFRGQSDRKWKLQPALEHHTLYKQLRVE